MTKKTPPTAVPLPSRGGCFVIEAGELRPDPAAAPPLNTASNTPLNAPETPPESTPTED